MSPILDPLDLALLDGWQRNFPLVPQPFAVIGRDLNLTESEVLDRLRRLSGAGFKRVQDFDMDKIIPQYDALM